MGDNAELLVIDGSGKHTGFDASAVSVIEEIPLSAHFAEAIQNDETGAPPPQISHSVQVRQPKEGNYRVVVSGLKLGTYTISLRAFSQDGSAQSEVAIPGVTGTHSVSSFSIQFSPISGSIPHSIRVSTFTTTIEDIRNSSQLGLISRGTAKALADLVEAAAAAAAQGREIRHVTPSIHVINCYSILLAPYRNYPLRRFGLSRTYWV